MSGYELAAGGRFAGIGDDESLFKIGMQGFLTVSSNTESVKIQGDHRIEVPFGTGPDSKNAKGLSFL